MMFFCLWNLSKQTLKIAYFEQVVISKKEQEWNLIVQCTYVGIVFLNKIKTHHGPVSTLDRYIRTWFACALDIFCRTIFWQRPKIDLTSLYKILQTSEFLYNVRMYSRLFADYLSFAKLQDPKFFYDMFQNYSL